MSAESPGLPGTPERTPTRFPRGTVILVGLASFTVVAIGISGIRGILAPVLLTLILVICVSPVRVALEKRGVPSGVATLAVMLSVFVLLGGFFYIVFVALGQFVAMLPSYSSQFAEIGTNIGNWLSSIGISQAQVQAAAQSVNPSNVAGVVAGAFGSVVSITGALVIIFTMIILMPADAVFAPTILKQLSDRQPHMVRALGEYTSNVRRYMVVTTLLGVAQGVLNALALAIMHVPAALLWGLLAFLCSFIPNVGYFFAIIPPIVFGFLVGGWPTVIAVVIVYGVINAVIQSVIQPRVVGHAVSLSQTITFFSVLFWAVVIGPIGAILAIPLTLLGKTILIDSDPSALWYRPAMGPTDETRKLMKSDDVEAKNQRRALKAEKHALRAPADDDSTTPE
ncbi:AI-2E family transporter [Subtercola endophyticus]|uniref:AI-2E family transporter n=1 Tax=Subtercola endophyticus TaxID=2895559 RepID=UPI001E4FA2D2|nr:AI-2E family transporter [Subtercola endophyticus]UFS59553.1 AI-2E family transporter [Subtercola endophyticus]